MRLILISLLLAGCAAQTQYKEVKVPVPVYKKIPAELTVPCKLDYLVPETWSDVTLLAQAALAKIDECNDQIMAIGELK